jgi:predicted nucleic acid-binding Zn ribbon protein
MTPNVSTTTGCKMARKTKKVYKWGSAENFFSLYKKNDEDFDCHLKEFAQELLFYEEFQRRGDTSGKILNEITERSIRRAQEKGFILIVPGTEVLSPMRKGIEKTYVIFDKITPSPKNICQYCDHPILHPRSTSQKYCSQRCRLLALYKRQGQKPIEIHTHCIQCGKPLSKRAGAKYCSSACNMAYRRKNIKGSSLPEPSALP